ncbi:putative Aldo/keto reductase [Blattamonas nauphoetae]|uniref:Aldo/keto reductase n=1 Tax=Blattamonas nauphoetae TaxID=2049346 RepID=A0ABQ9XJD1_9EUKA|nr:putative Aldo/keto reductase [Blattamonas nauphoetae]
MEYFRIPHSSKSLSSIALGTSRFKFAIKDTCFALLDEYVAQGGTIIDTGRMYGCFEAETVIGEWFKLHPEKRETIFLQTKGCHYKVDPNTNESVPSVQRVSARHLRKDVEASLAAFDLPYIDSFLIHRDNLEVPISELFDTLHEIRLEGKIHVYGISNWTLPRIEEAKNYCQLKGYQPISINSPAFSVAEVTVPQYPLCVYATPDYVRWCVDQGILLMCWAPNGTGFFSGKIHRTPEGEIQATMPLSPQFQESYFTEKNWKRLSAVEALAEEKK